MTEAELENAVARLQGIAVAHGTILAATLGLLPEELRSAAFKIAQIQLEGLAEVEAAQPTDLFHEVAREATHDEIARVFRLAGRFTPPGGKGKS